MIVFTAISWSLLKHWFNITRSCSWSYLVLCNTCSNASSPNMFILKFWNLISSDFINFKCLYSRWNSGIISIYFDVTFKVVRRLCIVMPLLTLTLSILNISACSPYLWMLLVHVAKSHSLPNFTQFKSNSWFIVDDTQYRQYLDLIDLLVNTFWPVTLLYGQSTFKTGHMSYILLC